MTSVSVQYPLVDLYNAPSLIGCDTLKAHTSITTRVLLPPAIFDTTFYPEPYSIRFSLASNNWFSETNRDDNITNALIITPGNYPNDTTIIDPPLFFTRFTYI